MPTTTASRATSYGGSGDAGGHVGGRLVAVRRPDALDEVLWGERVLLGADRLDDVRREDAADLSRPLVRELPLEPGQEARPERVAAAGGLDRGASRARLDVDRLGVAGGDPHAVGAEGG